MGDQTTKQTTEYEAIGPEWTQKMYSNYAKPQYGTPVYGEPVSYNNIFQNMQNKGGVLGSLGGLLGNTLGKTSFAQGDAYTPIAGYDYSQYQLDPSQYQIGGFEQLRDMYQPISAQMIGAQNISAGQMRTPSEIKAMMVQAGQMARPGEVNYQTEGDVRKYLEQAAQQSSGGQLGETNRAFLTNILQGGGMGDYDAYRNAVLADYQRNVAPTITESLAARGMLRGSGAREAAEQSAIDVANQLDQARYARELAAQQQQLQASGMAGQLGAQEYANLLGVAQGYGALGGQLAGIDQQNIANLMAQQRFNIGNKLAADLSNQQYNYQTQAQNIANQMAQQQFNIGAQLDAARANQAAQLQAAMANQGAGLQAGLANQATLMGAGQFDIANEIARQYQNQATQLGLDQYNIQMPIQMQQMDFANQMAAAQAAAGEYRPTEVTQTTPFNFANDILGPVLGAGGNILGSLLGGGFFGGGGQQAPATNFISPQGYTDAGGWQQAVGASPYANMYNIQPYPGPYNAYINTGGQTW